MKIDWMTMVGLAGVVLAISGSTLLPSFREWCKGFTSRTQPLRWLGIGLEFVGMVTDNAMATGFVLGLCWWSGPIPWGEVLVLSGLLTVASAIGDQGFAMLHALTVRMMGSGGGGGPAPAPFPIPRGRKPDGLPPPTDRLPVEGRLPDRPLTEDEVFDAMDVADEEADRSRGAVVGGRRR